MGVVVSVAFAFILICVVISYVGENLINRRAEKIKNSLAERDFNVDYHSIKLEMYRQLAKETDDPYKYEWYIEYHAEKLRQAEIELEIRRKKKRS